MATSDPKPVTGPLRCRTIGADDLEAVIGLLRRGFPDRSEEYWRRGFARHLARNPPDGYPIFGYLLECDGVPVGVVLTLHTATPGGPIRCNLSSWYVEPDFRAQGTLLDTVAMRRKDVTYFNVSPAPHTWAIQDARGFVRYSQGQMLVVPLLGRRHHHAAIRPIGTGDELADLPPFERELIGDHLSYGCICLLCTDADGSRPVIFQRRTIGLIPRVKSFGQLPALHLVYCRSIDDMPRLASALGRHLLRRHGMPWFTLDAEGPIAGLSGIFFPGRAPKYARGPDPVRLGDLAYTELVLFGP